MLKRVLWLLSFALLGWAIWRWWQDRTNDVFEVTPQFAPSVPPPDDTGPGLPPPPAPPKPPLAPPGQALDVPAADGQAEPAILPVDEAPEPASEVTLTLEVSAPPELALEVGAPAPTSTPSRSEPQPAAVGPAPLTAEAQPDAVAVEPVDGQDAQTPDSEAPTAADGAPADEQPPAAEDEAEDDSDNVITAYCVRCKTKRDMLNPQIETTENGRRAARGTCPVCSGTMFTFLKERAPGA